MKISNIVCNDEVVTSFKKDWEKISKILPPSQNGLNEEDLENIRTMAKNYCDSLLKSLDERFPEPQVLCAFRIFEIREIPSDPEKRKAFGNKELKLLLDRFNISTEKNPNKVFNDYQALKDRMVMGEFKECSDAADVCIKIAKDKLVKNFFPELHYLCCLALTIPLTTVWPERGFSTLSRIKTKQRNRLSIVMLNSLINVSMNGPAELTNKDAITIAQT